MDLISRQAVIDAVNRLSLGETDAVRLSMRIADYLNRIPPAQPTFDARDTQYNLPIGTDCISRQAAIDALCNDYCGGRQDCKHYPKCENLKAVQNLPSAQPEILACGEGELNVPDINVGDMISRQAAIAAIDECYCGGEDSCGEPWIYKENAVEAIEMVEPSPSAEPKRGKWIKTARWGRVYYCNQCRNYLDFDGVNAGRGSTNFCPNCGAKMEVDDE